MIDEHTGAPPHGAMKDMRADGADCAGDEAAVGRLEAELSAERQRSVTLAATIDQLQFRLDVLEKSYSTQLATTRERTEEAERALAEEQARLAELTTDHEEAVRLLKRMRGEIERVATGHERARMQHALDAGLHAIGQGDGEARAHDDTINRLLAMPGTVPEQSPESDQGELSKASSDPAAVSEDMLAPELVFPEEPEDDE